MIPPDAFGFSEVWVSRAEPSYFEIDLQSAEVVLAILRWIGTIQTESASLAWVWDFQR